MNLKLLSYNCNQWHKLWCMMLCTWQSLKLHRRTYLPRSYCKLELDVIESKSPCHVQNLHLNSNYTVTMWELKRKFVQTLNTLVTNSCLMQLLAKGN